MSHSETTTDPETIRKWAEARDGHPAIVRTGKEGGILRIDFSEKEQNLEPIDWGEFFRVFEESKPAFIFQEKPSAGKISRFSKFVNRDSAD